MGTAAVFFFFGAGATDEDLFLILGDGSGCLEPEGFLILTLDLTDDNDGVFFFF